MKQSYVSYLFYQEKVERRVPVVLSIGIKRAKIIDNVSRILFPISFGHRILLPRLQCISVT
jgi:hypothetical protein